MADKSLYHRLRASFAGMRLVYQNEVQLQSQVANVLADLKVAYSREFSLDRSNRIDFYIVADGIGIEIKIKGSFWSILRQLRRYAEYPSIKELILICPKPWSLPATLNHKPVHCVSFFASLV